MLMRLVSESYNILAVFSRQLILDCNILNEFKKKVDILLDVSYLLYY